MSSIKSVILKGDLKTNPLTYRLCPSAEFSIGAWKLSINSITYTCEDPNFKSHCSLSCNFVREQKFSAAEDSVITYQMPLVLFRVESGTTSVHTGNIKFEILSIFY